MSAPQITVVFNPPQISDSVEDFNTKAFDTVDKFSPWSSQANTLANYVNTKADEVAADAATTAGAAAAANTATTKAAEAAASAAAANDSKTAAAGSATAASGSASTASTQATAAGNSATAAASSATAANTAKTAAETAATNAGNSASAAATSATTANTKAGEASASASAALASKNAAATSEANALASKNAAAVSQADAYQSKLDAEAAAAQAAGGGEPTILPGTTAQYWRGDKTWQTLDKSAVGLSNADNVSAANLRDRATHTGTQPLSSISDAGTAAGKDVPSTGNASAGQVVLGNDSRLANAREWVAEEVSQVEAVTGIATTARKWTAVRVRQAAEAVYDAKQAAEKSVLIYNYSTDTYDTTGVNVTAAHKGMRRCLVTDDGNVNYYLDPLNSTKKADGTNAVLSGADGQVMVEIPRFYFSVENIGSVIRVTVSPLPLAGLILHPCFYTSERMYDRVYVGAYNATVQQPNGTIIPGLNLDDNRSRVNLSTDKLASLSGGNNYPMVGQSLTEFRTLAENRGSSVGWGLFDYKVWQALQVLAYTELGNFNGQTALGSGRVAVGSWGAPSSVQSDSLAALNGLTNGLGNGSGASSTYMSYKGVEHLWGNVYQFVDGVLFDDAQTYVGDTVYGDSVTSDYTPVGSPVSSVGSPDSWHYIGAFQNLSSGYFIPATGTGDSSKFVGDGAYYDTGVHGALVGGSAEDGSLCGLASLSVDGGLGTRYRTFGSRLMLKPKF